MSEHIRGSTALRVARQGVGILWWITIGVAGLMVVDLGSNFFRSDGDWGVGGEMTVTVSHVPIREEIGEGRVTDYTPASLNVSPRVGDDRVVRVEVEDFTASLAFYPALGFGLLTVAPGFLMLIGALYWLHRLRALLGAVGEGRVFTQANARRLWQMGAITLGAGLAWPVFDFGRARLLREAIDLGGGRIVSSGFDYSFLLMGLLLLTLAAVWRYGIELEEDRQLTV